MTSMTLGRETIRNNSQDMTPGLMGKVKGYLNRTRAERQLHGLDDRMLRDIGLARSEITQMVWGN